MIKAVCKALDNQTRRGNWRLACFPAINFGNVNGRKHLRARRGQLGLRPGQRGLGQLRFVRARHIPDADSAERDKNERDIPDVLPHILALFSHVFGQTATQ